jgi:hypothetical protein
LNKESFESSAEQLSQLFFIYNTYTLKLFKRDG